MTAPPFGVGYTAQADNDIAKMAAAIVFIGLPLLKWCRRRDSNPHCTASKAVASYQLRYFGIEFGLNDGHRPHIFLVHSQGLYR